LNSLHEEKLKGGRRMATNYYNQMLKEGTEYQDYIIKELSKIGIHIQCFSSKKYQYSEGESFSKAEIKLDKMMGKTGNLWIETEEKTSATNLNYMPSGLNRESLHWIQGNYIVAFMFSTKSLIEYITRNSSNLRFIENSMKTSRGYLLPVATAEKICMCKFRFKDGCVPDQILPVTEHYNRMEPRVNRAKNERDLSFFGF